MSIPHDELRDRGSLCRQIVRAARRRLARNRSPEPPDRADATNVARIKEAFRSLPPVTREVFILHRFDDLPYDRIGARLRIGVDEVEAHIAAALIQLCRAQDDDR
jgi:RNA polymerase sigma-70 factor (ECF subfamily)